MARPIIELSQYVQVENYGRNWSAVCQISKTDQSSFKGGWWRRSKQRTVLLWCFINLNQRQSWWLKPTVRRGWVEGAAPRRTHGFFYWRKANQSVWKLVRNESGQLPLSEGKTQSRLCGARLWRALKINKNFSLHIFASFLFFLVCGKIFLCEIQKRCSCRC